MTTPTKLHVPLLDLKPQYQALKAELDAAMLKVAESQWFILGAYGRELEEPACRRAPMRCWSP